VDGGSCIVRSSKLLATFQGEWQGMWMHMKREIYTQLWQKNMKERDYWNT
jgi:hypothetical protein